MNFHFLFMVFQYICHWLILIHLNFHLYLHNISFWPFFFNYLPYFAVVYISTLLVLISLKRSRIRISLLKVESNQILSSFLIIFLDFWNGERVDAIGSNRGKLDTYFYTKTHFGKEKYLQINNFKIRQSICKIRVSAHSLNIETGRYKIRKKMHKLF